MNFAKVIIVKMYLITADFGQQNCNYNTSQVCRKTDHLLTPSKSTPKLAVYRPLAIDLYIEKGKW